MGVLTWTGGRTTDIVAYRNGENLFRNPSFNINQRGVTGTVTLAAYAYGHDGLIAAGNGATYTYALAANGIDTIITITAGQLVLPVAPELIDGTQLCFSFTGTAGFRVATGQTVKQGGAPISSTSWFSPSVAQGAGGYTFTPGANVQTNIMFGDPANANNPVTFSVPQLERVIQGVTPTRFQRRDPADELLRCQRYYQQLGGRGSPFDRFIVGFAYNSTSLYTTGIRFNGFMRSVPTLTYSGAFGVFNGTAASGGVNATVTAIQFDNVDVASGNLNLGCPSGSNLTVGGFYDFLANQDGTAKIGFSSELA